MNSSFRQSGAALIIALMVVALVTSLSVRFATDYQLGMARAETRWHGTQARQYLLGAERLAMHLLREDDPSVDSPVEPWAQELPPFELDGGWLHADIEDAQARLNLNGLLSALDPEMAHTDPERYTPEQRRFIRLLQSFPEEAPMAEDDAIAALEAVVDWMSPSSEPTGFGGAGSGYYQSLDPPYLPANTYFASVEELRLVRHIDGELMALLRPYLAALPPQHGDPGMNLNTLPPRLLGTIHAADRLQPLAPMEVEMLRQSWPLEGHYKSRTEFAQNPGWETIAPGQNNLDTQGLTINTNYFTVQASVSLGDQRRTMASLLMREGDNRFRVIRRTDTY